jgi:hypothetical protein
MTRQGGLIDAISNTSWNLQIFRESSTQKCTGLHGITTPTAVEVISAAGFSECGSLTEVLLTNGSHLRERDQVLRDADHSVKSKLLDFWK